MSESDSSLDSATSAEDDALDLAPIYCQLRAKGLNCVDGIIQVLQQAQVIDKSELSQKMVRKMFRGVPDKNDVQFEPFRVVVTQLSTGLEFLKIAWRLKEAEFQLQKAEKEINKAISKASKNMCKSLDDNKTLTYNYSRTTIRRH